MKSFLKIYRSWNYQLFVNNLVSFVFIAFHEVIIRSQVDFSKCSFWLHWSSIYQEADANKVPEIPDKFNSTVDENI